MMPDGMTSYLYEQTGVCPRVSLFRRHDEECAVMGWTTIGSIVGKDVAIAIAGAGAFVIANYVLEWL
jgi:hypothetical protein